MGHGAIRAATLFFSCCVLVVLVVKAQGCDQSEHQVPTTKSGLVYTSDPPPEISASPGEEVDKATPQETAETTDPAPASTSTESDPPPTPEATRKERAAEQSNLGNNRRRPAYAPASKSGAVFFGDPAKPSAESDPLGMVQ